MKSDIAEILCKEFAPAISKRSEELGLTFILVVADGDNSSATGSNMGMRTARKILGDVVKQLKSARFARGRN